MPSPGEGRRVGQGPAESPKLQWDLDLGAVVFAAPVIVSQTDGMTGPTGPGVSDPVAYVGTHAGRFVGVVVEGDQAGTLVVDRFVEGIVWRRAAWDEDAGRLYFGADDDTLYAMDIATGELAWRTRLGNCSPPRAPGPEGVRCDVDGGPTIGPDGDLYVGADGVYRISPDGKVRWRAPDAEDVKYASHVYSIPLVTEGVDGAEGLVVHGGHNGTLTARSTTDGTERWTVSVGADVDGSAVQGADGTIYVGSDNGNLLAVGLDGSVKWTFDTGAEIRSAVGLTPDGGIIVPSFSGSVTRLSASGEAQWVLPTEGPVAGTPVFDADGTLFVGSRDDRLYAVGAAGQVLWNVEFPSDIDSSVAISPLGTLVVGSDDGHLRALR